MSISFKKLLRETEKISLTRSEKTSIRKTLSLFIQKNHVRNEAPNRHGFEIHQRSFLTPFNWLMPKTAMPIILVITLFVGATASYAADESLPGELLYPMKLNVNETVRGAFSFSTENKADWEVRILERRLEELEKLAAKGRLNSKTRTEIDSRFGMSTLQLDRHIKTLERDADFEGAADIRSRSEASLRAHIKILEKLASQNPDIADDVLPLLNTIKDKTAKAVEEREKTETKVSAGANTDVKAAAEGKLKASEHKISEVRRFLERVKETLGTQATGEAEARLKLAENIVAEGKTKLDRELYGDAFVLFQKAHRIAQEAKLLIEARRELEIDLRLNGILKIEDEDGEFEVEDGDEEEGENRDEDLEEDDENIPDEGDENRSTIDGDEKNHQETNNGTKNRGAIEGSIQIDLGL